MSREFKFRAWESKEKRWAAHQIMAVLKNLIERLELKDCLSISGRLIIEQYTGLKDRNDREIYEGDIVKYGNQVFEVKFDEMEDSSCSYYYLGWAMGGLSLCEHYGMVVVIGNIHENPELLGGEK